MPRSSFPAAARAEYKKRQGFMRLVLLDIQLRDGTTYYLSDYPGTFPVKIGAGPTAVYLPWVKSAGPFRLTKSLQADAGDIVLQNLSGNSIDRDVAAAMKAHEFEGALCVVRFWNELLQLTTREHHGTLGEQHDLGDEAGFRFLQLFDTNPIMVPVDPWSTACVWQFKDGRCGSTGSATSCPKDFASCIDATRAVPERHTGMPIVPPSLEFYQKEEPNPLRRGRRFEIIEPTIMVTYSDRSNPDLTGFRVWACGKVRGGGVTALEHTRASSGGVLSGSFQSIIQLFGEGEWDGIENMWISKRRVDPTDATQFHFHAGADGTIGGGLASTSTGPDQGVDTFWLDLPSAIQRITFSRIAYMFMKIAGGANDVHAVPEITVDARSQKFRSFDNTGAQLAFAFTSTPTWCILGAIIRFMLKSQGLSGAALTAAEKTRINFVDAAQHATDCDFDIGGGIHRFETHLAISKQVQFSVVLGQMLQMCQSYMFEDAGAISIRMDKARASTFTLTSDMLNGRVRQLKTNKRNAPNRFIGHFRDLNTSKIADIETLANNGAVRAGGVVTIHSTAAHQAQVGDFYVVAGVSVGTNSFNGTFPVTTVPDATHLTYTQAGANETQGGGTLSRDESRYMEDSKIVDHEEHQAMAGQRGVGLSIVPRVISIDLDFGNNTPERVERLLRFIAVRNLGVGLLNGDLAGAAYRIPREVECELWMDSVDAANNAIDEQIPGDRITIDKSCSEEWQGDYEIMQMEVPRVGAGSTDPPVIKLKLLEYVAAAFSDVAGPQPLKGSPYSQGGYLLDNIGPDGHYTVTSYHDSAGQVGNTTNRTGSTQSATYVTVASYTVHLPPRVPIYAGVLQCLNPDAASFVLAGTGSNVAGGGFAWVNPTNISAQDTTYATNPLNIGNVSDNLAARFGFSIPSYHTILGIQVKMIMKASVAARIKDSLVKLVKAGGQVGNNKGTNVNWGIVDQTNNYGANNDLWGTTWTPADINAANFGVDLQVTCLGGAATASVDYVEITVTTDRGSTTGKARLKIGAQLSGEVILTSPAVAASASVRVTGLTGGTDILVEVQGLASAGAVTPSFAQNQYTDQHYLHFL